MFQRSNQIQEAFQDTESSKVDVLMEKGLEVNAEVVSDVHQNILENDSNDYFLKRKLKQEEEGNKKFSFSPYFNYYHLKDSISVLHKMFNKSINGPEKENEIGSGTLPNS
eukprot:snap_masked-scaffold_7-processed-gene-14.18-mRNA-1 protein AED:1.00 eAED:1.00 QI:0/0/0/0/1/1/2/0/109